MYIKQIIKQHTISYEGSNVKDNNCNTSKNRNLLVYWNATVGRKNYIWITQSKTTSVLTNYINIIKDCSAPLSTYLNSINEKYLITSISSIFVYFNNIYLV